jgi:hypothetical protein
VTDTRQLVASFAARLDARDWEGLTALLHPELLYEMPQSGERIRGRDRYVAFNAEYPGSWNVVPQLILADDTDGCLLFRWVTADGDDPPSRSSASTGASSHGSPTSSLHRSSRRPAASTSSSVRNNESRRLR